MAPSSPGSCLTLRQEGDGTNLLTANGVVVGRLARAYQPPAGLRCTQAGVAAIVQRRREDSTAEYADRLALESWEVVVPALTYEP